MVVDWTMAVVCVVDPATFISEEISGWRSFHMMPAKKHALACNRELCECSDVAGLGLR